MIIQFYSPGVVLQCRECKHFKTCKDGKRNPDASHCGSGEPTPKAEAARKKLQTKLSQRDSVEMTIAQVRKMR